MLGADERTRTAGLLITNQLLYQLSYVGNYNRSKVLSSEVQGDSEAVNAYALDEVFKAQRRTCISLVKKCNSERGTLNLLTANYYVFYGSKSRNKLS
jgi:hypothetical protein